KPSALKWPRAILACSLSASIVSTCPPGPAPCASQRPLYPRPHPNSSSRLGFTAAAKAPSKGPFEEGYKSSHPCCLRWGSYLSATDPKRSAVRVCFSIHRLTAAGDFGSWEGMAPIVGRYLVVQVR